MRKKRVTSASVVATGSWTEPDGVRAPAESVHAWVQGTNQTVCGLALSREGLQRFPHVSWAEIDPATGIHADEVTDVCRRCSAGMGARRGEQRWTRSNPRP